MKVIDKLFRTWLKLSNRKGRSLYLVAALDILVATVGFFVAALDSLFAALSLEFRLDKPLMAQIE